MSILQVFSRIFGKTFQIKFLVFLSKCPGGFWKGDVTPNCLLMMLEFWKDTTESVANEPMKSVRLFCHDLLIAKLHVYGLEISYLNLL